MTLDERKRAILKALIDDYIDTAEPIGSRTLARKHELGLSSATIRNEMADLELLGFLAQPHTSAGRIPSDKGYRIYVDELMNLKKLTGNEIKCIKEAMEVRINEIGQLIKVASSIMSQITKYTSMALMPKIKKVRIMSVQVVPIDAQKVLAIVVTDAGVVRNSMVKLATPVSADSINKISNFLDRKLRGLSYSQLNSKLASNWEKELSLSREILTAIMDGVMECLRQMDSSELYLKGMINMFNFPEFNNMLKAQEFLNILDTKEVLQDVMQQRCDEVDGIDVKIGTENELNEVKDYSIILANYSLDGEVLGSIGVIGPTRMEYPKVISSLNYIRKKLNEDLAKMLGNRSE